MANRYPFHRITAQERAGMRRRPGHRPHPQEQGDFDDMGRPINADRYHAAQKRRQGRF